MSRLQGSINAQALIRSAELKRKLSEAQSEYQAVKSQNTTVGVICLGLLILGILLTFADSMFGMLLFFAGIGGIFLFMDEAKSKELENTIGVLKGHLTRNKRFESAKMQSMDRASTLLQEGGLANLQEVLKIYSKYGKNISGLKKEIAQEKEKLLDYESAIIDFKKMGMHDDAKRVRRKMLDEKKVDQTVVHGDYVDDRDTIVKDSVISKSNIGAGGDDKFSKLKELTEMKEKGLIDDDEFQQMKKEILG